MTRFRQLQINSNAGGVRYCLRCRLRIWNFFGVKEFFSWILISKMDVKMNFRMIMKNDVADQEIGFLTKPPCRQRGGQNSIFDSNFSYLTKFLSARLFFLVDQNSNVVTFSFLFWFCHFRLEFSKYSQNSLVGGNFDSTIPFRPQIINYALERLILTHKSHFSRELYFRVEISIKVIIGSLRVKNAFVSYNDLDWFEKFIFRVKNFRFFMNLRHIFRRDLLKIGF